MNHIDSEHRKHMHVVGTQYNPLMRQQFFLRALTVASPQCHSFSRPVVDLSVPSAMASSSSAQDMLQDLWCNAPRAGTLSPQTQGAALAHRAVWLAKKKTEDARRSKKGKTQRGVKKSHVKKMQKREFAKRNSHGVDAETIARMKDRYEPDVAEELA